MGAVHITIEVGHLDGGDLEALPEVPVDTGACHSMLPASLLESLHVEHRQNNRYELIDGRIVEYDMGAVRMVIEGQDWPCVVVFGPEDRYLLGQTALQIFGLVVDPAGERLIPFPRPPLI